MSGRERAARVLRSTDLVGARVVDDRGGTVGRVIDLEVRPLAGWQVVAVVLGRHAVLDRSDTFRAIRYGSWVKRERLVAWADVAAVEAGTITLRSGASVVTAQNEPTTGTAGESAATDRGEAGQ